MKDLKYALTHFSPEEAEDYRKFLLIANNVDIIAISREDIEKEYEEFLREGMGSDVRIVLHDETEANRFHYIMKYFFGGKEHVIEDEPGDEKFAAFVERSEQKRELEHA